MPNTNILEGMRCSNPECESEGPFRIVCTATFLVYDDGTDEHEDVQWDNESSCICLFCGEGGTVKDFNTKETTHALP